MKSRAITYGEFVVGFPEADSVSRGVVNYFSERYFIALKSVRNELWMDWDGRVCMETLRHYIETDSNIYRRKDRKICLRNNVTPFK